MSTTYGNPRSNGNAMTAEAFATWCGVPTTGTVCYECGEAVESDASWVYRLSWDAVRFFCEDHAVYPRGEA